MRIASLLLASFLLAGCGHDSGQETSNAGAAADSGEEALNVGAAADSGEDASNVGVADSAEDASNTRAAGSAEGTSNAGAAEETPAPGVSTERDWFFVGRWASDVKNCGDKAWVITAQGLKTPGHVVCRFDEVEATTRGAAAHAICTAEGPPQPWTIQFSYAESARALLIEDAPFSDVGLVACAAP